MPAPLYLFALTLAQLTHHFILLLSGLIDTNPDFLFFPFSQPSKFTGNTTATMSNNNSSPLSPGDQPEKATVGGTPKGNKKANGVELTAVEGLLFFNIIRFNKDTSAVDWDQVAIHSNLKNAASAKASPS